MSIYSISCSIYSSYIQHLNQYFGKNHSDVFDIFPTEILGIKRVYIASQLIYAIGMLLMGYFRHRLAVIILSAAAGILYSTLFTIPYLLISQYYAANTVGQPMRLTREFCLQKKISAVVRRNEFDWTNPWDWN